MEILLLHQDQGPSSPYNATTLSLTSLSLSFPLPIPSCLASPSGSYFNAGVTEGSKKYFTPPQSLSQPEEESAPSSSTTVAALEEALSEGATEVKEGEIVYGESCLAHVSLLEDLEVGGWTHLCDEIVNHIT